MIKICASCARFTEQSEKSRPSSLPPRRLTGICSLDGKSRDGEAMKDCFGWREADPWVIEGRGYELDDWEG